MIETEKDFFELLHKIPKNGNNIRLYFDLIKNRALSALIADKENEISFTNFLIEYDYIIQDNEVNEFFAEHARQVDHLFLSYCELFDQVINRGLQTVTSLFTAIR